MNDDLSVYFLLEDDADLLPNLQNYQSKEEEDELSNTKDEEQIDAPAGMKYILKQVKQKDPQKIMEVKRILKETQPSKSKWASNTRSGQEILYPALEKVLNALKGYTEHSFPFLKPVQRREAPNYYDIITNPMDLSTISKNLKNLTYNSKQEFKTDLDLIWSNCLQYNTLPDSIYRKHSIMMAKKAENLLKKVPEIVIKTFTYGDDTENEINNTTTASVAEASVEADESVLALEDHTTNTEMDESMNVDSEGNNSDTEFDFISHEDQVIEEYNKRTIEIRVPKLKRMIEDSRLPFGERTAVNLVPGLCPFEYPELYCVSTPTCYIPADKFQTQIQEFIEPNSEIPRPPLPSLSEYEARLSTESKLTLKLQRNVKYLKTIKEYYGMIVNKQIGYNDEYDKFGNYSKMMATRTEKDLPKFFLDGASCNSICVQKVAFLLEHQGFDCGTKIAVEAMADILAHVLQNTGKTLKAFLDKFGNQMSDEEIVLHTLQEAGADPSGLMQYMKEDADRYGRKLKNTAERLQLAYLDYQRRVPGEDEEVVIDEEAIMAGNFFSESGVDFFNLKDIGLNFTIPDSLWRMGSNKVNARVKQSLLPR